MISAMPASKHAAPSARTSKRITLSLVPTWKQHVFLSVVTPTTSSGSRKFEEWKNYFNTQFSLATPNILDWVNVAVRYQLTLYAIYFTSSWWEKNKKSPAHVDNYIHHSALYKQKTTNLYLTSVYFVYCICLTICFTFHLPPLLTRWCSALFFRKENV